MSTAAPAPAAGCPAPRAAHCFTFTVPLDHSGVVPGTITIRAARIRSRHPTLPPIVGLTGGPGQAGVIFTSTYQYLLPTAGRDLVMLDQRGTGASGLLRCPSLEHVTTSFARAIGMCGDLLGPRRAFYTSADSAEDVETLRQRLGVPKIALYAVSYGTRVAVEYARRYPQHVERMILDSAIGIGAPDSLARETLGAVGRVVRTVCHLGCGSGAAHPVTDIARLVPRLRRAPLHGLVTVDRHRVPVSVGADDLLDMLVSGDLLPSYMRRIPAAVHAALHGDGRALVLLKASLSGGGDAGGSQDRVSDFDSAVYAATTCEESTFAWDASAAPATRALQAHAALDAIPASVFAPFDRQAGLDFGLLPLCQDWPALSRVTAPEPPLPTTVPTLILSGDLDLRTPLENARKLATALHAKLVVERNAGHGVLGQDPNGCATPAVQAFLARRPIPGCSHAASISITARSASRPPAVDRTPRPFG